MYVKQYHNHIGINNYHLAFGNGVRNLFLFAAVGISTLISFLQSLELDQMLNLAEGILWITISCLFLVRLHRAQQNRDLAITCIIAFALFGVSDFIEVSTRAWYQPVSLLILKAGCVVTLITVYIIYGRRQKKCPDPPQQ